jgi:Druantia protein DruA
MTRYCGRDFTSKELEQILSLIKHNPGFNRTRLSTEVCKMFQWLKPDGKLKDMSCRVAMLRMNKDELIRLPPSTRAKKPVKKIKFTLATEPQRHVVSPVHKLPQLHMQMVTQTTSALWNEYIERYHYLGHATLPGAQLRYFITTGEQIVALTGFGAAAWQTAPRDQFIGWNHDQRKKNLNLVVNNARFLILPWIQSKNLASKILSLMARHLPDDWENRYNIRPVLLESFVQKDRFAGTCYKAANWQNIGETKGRGKLGQAGKISVPIKDIWVFPLNKKFRLLLKN